MQTQHLFIRTHTLPCVLPATEIFEKLWFFSHKDYLEKSLIIVECSALFSGYSQSWKSLPDSFNFQVILIWKSLHNSFNIKLRTFFYFFMHCTYRPKSQILFYSAATENCMIVENQALGDLWGLMCTSFIFPSQLIVVKHFPVEGQWFPSNCIAQHF